MPNSKVNCVMLYEESHQRHRGGLVGLWLQHLKCWFSQNIQVNFSEKGLEITSDTKSGGCFEICKFDFLKFTNC